MSQLVYPGQANIVTLPIVARATVTPIEAGTVNFYLVAQDGDNAGKWYRGSDTSWQAAEAVAGAATHVADGHWKRSLPSAVWEIGVTYYMYAKESGDLHVPVGEQVLVTGQIEGPGNRAVTLTIRDTDSSPLSGVSVWLSTSNDSSDSITAVKTTSASGVVTFYLHYGVTYYIHCDLSAYTFISANMAPASGTVAFTKDIGAAVGTAGSSTDYEESFLSRAIKATRDYTDEPAINAKYSDVEIITELEQSYILVLGEKKRNEQEPIVGRATITMTATDTAYVLPYTGSLHSIYQAQSNYKSKIFYDSRGGFNELGRGIWVEGNTLHIQYTGAITAGTILTVEWIPRGTARLHVGTCSLNAAGTIATFGTAPSIGALDTHADAYVGCTLRIVNVTGTSPTANYTQERIITAYDRTTREATLDVALSPVPVAGAGGYIYYEIAPSIPVGMDQVVASRAAYRILTKEGNVKRGKAILEIHRNELRAVRLDAFYSNLMGAGRVRSDGFNVNRYRMIGR